MDPPTPEIVSELPSELRVPDEPRGAGPGRSVPEAPAPQRLGWHAALFFATFVSALWAQTSRTDESLLGWLTGIWFDPARLSFGLAFAGTLMTILLAHEMGHYVTARVYGVDQSLPFFIPAPFVFFGTLGAVIVMRSQPSTRTALLRVAVMGPYAGMLLALPAAAWGLAHSVPVDMDALAGGGLIFGDSIMFKVLEEIFSPNGTDVILHPVAMAAWVGLFITSLNLIPAAQLDGGHIAYALLGPWHLRLSLAVAVTLLFMGIQGMVAGDGSGMWAVWGILLFVIGLRHPPVQQPQAPLLTSDKINGLLALLLFLLTFIPVPLRIVAPMDEEEDAAPPSYEFPMRHPDADGPADDNDNGEEPPQDDGADGDTRRRGHEGEPADKAGPSDGRKYEEFKL